MNVLAVETSTNTGSVALEANGIISDVVISVEQKQNEALLPAIDELLVRAGVARNAIDAVVIGAGPGSFTGLRIAAATGKGLVHSLGIPLFAYSGLLAAAVEFEKEASVVCALFDARRDEVYAGTYRLDDSLSELRAPTAEAIHATLAAHDCAATLFVGDGAVKHRLLIQAAGGRVAETDFAVPRARTLIALAQSHPDLGRVENAASWEPDYVRASGAERGIRG